MSREDPDFPFPESASRDLVSACDIPTPLLSTVRVWGVTELLSEIAYRLDAGFPRVRIEGEVSNLRKPASGHLYFTLKDGTSQIRAVLFRNQAVRVPFPLVDGDYIVCLARVGVYAGRGDLQLVVEAVERKGEGELRRAFEALKQRLFQEGLFDAEVKKGLPLVPDRVFVITSPAGAAFWDFLRTARSRFPAARIVLCPVKVQGEGAAEEMVRALETIRMVCGKADVVVLTRGGGSLEDLWAFNDETLARAIFGFPVPVVSGVGHEVDFTMADFVADHRAATPTAAAQAVFPEEASLRAHVSGLARRAADAARHRIARAANRLHAVRFRLRDPSMRVVEGRFRHDEFSMRLAAALRGAVVRRRERLDALEGVLLATDPRGRILRLGRETEGLSIRLGHAVPKILDRKRSDLSLLSGKLQAMSPLRVLARGYSIVYGPSGEIVRSFRDVVPGDRVEIHPLEGVIRCDVVGAGAAGRKPESAGGTG